MRNRLSLLVLAALTLAPLAANAQQYRRPLKRAVDALDDAASRARRAGGQCKTSVYDTIDRLVDQVDDLKKDPRPRDLGRARGDVSNAAQTASWAGCPDAVLQALHNAEDFLDDARTAVLQDRGNGRGDGRGRDDDDDDVRFSLAQLQPLTVQVNSSFEGEPAVRVQVPELSLRSMRGQQFYLGARFRSFQGHWSDWVTTQQWSVPSDPFVWRTPFTHFFRYSTLAEEDFSNGRFVARVSVFDQGGRELAFREVTFTARLPQLPTVQPVPPPMQPPVVQQPPPQIRDCGTGPDVGCGVMRDGRLPMDAATFGGFQRALQANRSDMQRAQAAQSMFQANYVTAVQYGLILDLFQSEVTRFQVAQVGASHLVNPQHALGYADKFNSNMNRTAYTQLISQQMQLLQGGVPGQPPFGNRPPPPPPPGNPNPTIPPPPPPGNPYQGARDCGTGPQDQGCLMQRNGLWAMDAQTWAGFYASLRAQPNELVRAQMVNDVLRTQAITALQLGLLMDLFNNELTRLDMCKQVAVRVTNPMQALGWSTKFRNGILAQDYVSVMSQQR